MARSTHAAFHKTPQFSDLCAKALKKFEPQVQNMAEAERAGRDVLDVSYIYPALSHHPWGHWNRVQQPVLVIAGTDDAMFLAAQEYLVASTPNAEIEYVPATQHCPHLEAPQHYRNVALSFLQRHCRPATEESFPGVASQAYPKLPKEMVDFCTREGIAPRGCAVPVLCKAWYVPGRQV